MWVENVTVSDTTMYIIRAEGVTKSVRLASGDALHILRGAELAVEAGEFVAVVGRSGSGKSTLLALLGLLDRPTAGTVHVAGQDTGRLSDRKLSSWMRHGLLTMSVRSLVVG